MDHSKKITYLFSIDALRVFAILGVLIIHLTTKTLGVIGLDPNLAPFSLFLNQTARFAVPLFFFISGFVLELNYKEKLSYGMFFKKRASRIIIPFIFWSCFYYLLGHTFPQLFSFGFLLTLIQGKASYQLYFIPTLILFYIFFPFLHKILNMLRNVFILVGLIIIQALIVSYDYYYSNFSVPYIFRIALLVWMMFILGMLASHYKEKIMVFMHKKFRFMLVVLLIFLPIIFFHSKILFLSTRRIGYIYSQYHLINYIYTLLFAGVIYYLLETKQWGKNFLILLSKLSFFVFFVHVLVLDLTWNLIAKKLIEENGKAIVGNLWFDPLLFLVITTISFGIAYCVHKIPLASRITG